jgi:hypothetical protein
MWESRRVLMPYTTYRGGVFDRFPNATLILGALEQGPALSSLAL